MPVNASTCSKKLRRHTNRADFLTPFFQYGCAQLLPTGAGQTYYYLPLVALTRPPNPPAAALRFPLNARSTAPGILVADDDEGIRNMLGMFLSSKGYEVCLAADGNEALHLYRDHWRKIKVALLDVLMPGRDGPSTMGLLLKINPSLSCVIMTGDSGNYTLPEIMALGAKRVVLKPLSLESLAKELETLCAPNH